GGSLRLRKIALAMPERGEAFLEVQRHRVIDGVPDARLLEPLAERVAATPRHAEDQLVIDVRAPERLARERESAVLVAASAVLEEETLDLGRVLPPRGGPAVQARQL